MTEIQRYTAHNAASDKAMLKLRRAGLSPDAIAEELGFENGFEVRERLNEIFRELNARKPHGFRAEVNETIHYVDGKIDDLVTVFQEKALEGDYKAANFVLKALELKAKVNNVIEQQKVEIKVVTEKPWERVYRETIYTIVEEPQENSEGHLVLEGEVTSNDG